MHTISINAYGKAVICIMSMLLLTACTAEDEATKVSTDIAALQKIVNLPLTPVSAKWELFGTPEYTGGVPGPTDVVTLIAELAPVDEAAFAAQAPAGKVWIAPESARPWLTQSFHSMLEENKNRTVDLSTNTHCRSFNATLKQTGKPVSGFACSDAGKLLVYLTISDYSHS